jgi:hypothetical protein
MKQKSTTICFKKTNDTKFVVKLQRPVCRTPIKPLQKHKNAVKYDRKDAKKSILSSITNLGE